MTSASDRRLQRVEESLYPTEAMALWLQEARQHHRSLGELVESLRPQPVEAWPLFRLTRQAEAGAKGRLKSYASVFTGRKGERAEFLERGGRDAVRDAATLWYLFVEVNGRFLAEKRALHLLFGLLSSDYRQWIKEGKLPKRHEPLDRQLAAALAELYAWQEAVGMLRERYYQGVTPLLPEVEETLDWIVEQAEGLVERFNDHLSVEAEEARASRKRKPALPKPIDVAAMRDMTHPAAEAHSTLLVDMARAEAHEMMGERQRVLAIVARHL